MRLSNLVMKLSGSRCEFALFLIVAGFLYLAEVADGANEFRRCYNTSVEMHCFDLQYDTTKNYWLTASFGNAQRQCNILNSTLIIIKDEETNKVVQEYLSDPSNPIINQYVWTDAYRISDYNNSYTWHWVNSKLPNLAASEVSWLYDSKTYVATLEFRSDNGKLQFYLTAKQPNVYYNYVCEYAVFRCNSTGSNVLQFPDRCYISFSASVSWYEARNRCLKDGGDLASFSNVSSINFTSWLGSVPYSVYWIGLRFTWYIWKNSGEDVKFASWTTVTGDWNYPCLAAYYNSNGRSYWYPKDCNIMNSIYVVCHTVTTLQATALTSTSTTTLPVTTSTSITTPTGNAQLNSTEPLSASKEKIALAVGVGVGVGVPVVVAIIIIVICVVRSKTPVEKKTRNDKTELGTVQEPSAGQGSVSANDQYEQLNRNLDNSSAPMYDELRVPPETQYEEFPSNIT